MLRSLRSGTTRRTVTGLHLPSPTPSVRKHRDAVNGTGVYINRLVLGDVSLLNSPQKRNPEYKGKWYAPMIDNPAYKGEWAARKIPNPDFFEDLTPIKSLQKIVGLFDNMSDIY